MQTLQSLHDVWQRYFTHTPNINGGDAWSIVFIARDTRGVLISLANPFSEENVEIFVSTVSRDDLHTFESHYKSRYMKTLDTRFGFFRPEVDRVLTEYPDWQTFYDAWLNDSAQLVQGNMPLLFDYPTSDEYRAMQLKDADYAGYRRLLVVIYQYRKQRFQRVFIKNVDDADYYEIQKQIVKLFATSLPELITTKTVSAI